MAEAILFPSLSEDGWVQSPDKIADYMLSHFFVSDYSQTYNYKGQVSSLPWILQDTQGNITQACTAVRAALNTYFSRYFNSVVVEVRELPNPDSPTKGQITIYVNFTDAQGKVYVLGKLLQIADTIIEKIININNG